MTKLALIEPYYGGSHAYWADELKKRLSLQIELFTMPARHWKWRMQGSAITLSKSVLESPNTFDLFLVSEMTDLGLFRTLLGPKYSSTPFILYMHENQLTYPMSTNDKEQHFDLSYGYLNYKSCLAADMVVFNSHFHKNQFLNACARLLTKMPDHSVIETIQELDQKSKILSIGLDIQNIEKITALGPSIRSTKPIILWNHRWDEDKNPAFFIEILLKLKSRDIEFDLLLTNASNDSQNIHLKNIKQHFNSNILYCSFCENYQEYIRLIHSADLLFVSPGHDFFGISVLEAIISGASPLLPVGYVYEEHFKLEQLSDHFYTDTTDCTTKLIHLLKNTKKQNKNAFTDQIKKYDWPAVIPQYEYLLINSLSKT